MHRHHRRCTRLPVIIPALLLFLGCSDDGPDPICDNGATQECVCTTGEKGAQTCVDGLSWGPCQCDPRDAGVDGAAPDAPHTDIGEPDAGGPDAPTPDTGEDTGASDLITPDAKTCMGNTECDDQLPCTTDLCISGACANLLSGYFCLIGGQCYLDGATNPANTCHFCNPQAYGYAWSDSDGTGCDDGNPCTTGETCTGGLCQGNSVADSSSGISSATPLQAGTLTTGHICPVGDHDVYQVTVPLGHDLLHVTLQPPPAASPVKVTYALLDSQGQTLFSLPAAASATMDLAHCTGDGTFYLQAQDEQDANQDPNQPYSVSVTTTADKDTGEANNTDTTATPVSAGSSSTGYISCVGDVDYYAVTVNAGDLLQVTLSTGAATDLDLVYSVYAPGLVSLGGGSLTGADQGPASSTTLHAAAVSGTFLVAVQDSGADEADPDTGYTLALSTLADPDANEQPARNDAPASATILGSYTCGSGTVVLTSTRYLASVQDIDVFKVDAPACIGLAVMEISIDFQGASAVDPQVSLIYPHTTTPCTSDACCGVTGAVCQDLLDCLGTSTQCTAKGSTHCADATCEPSPSPTCASELRCVGAGVCLPGGACGAPLALRSDADGSDGALVKTAQLLLHDGPWYIRVSDAGGDDQDLGQPYTLTVRIQMDPDGISELNSGYFVEPELASLGFNANTVNADAAKAKGLKINLAQAVTGSISYEGDQDWYVLDFPCTGDVCVLTATYSYTGTNCPVGTLDTDGDSVVDDGLELQLALRRADGSPLYGFPATPTTGVGGSFGHPTTCFVVQDKAQNSSYLLSVADLAHNSWSWTCGYQVEISKGGEGCMVPCKTYSGLCYP
jgi:hypothetical protein